MAHYDDLNNKQIFAYSSIFVVTNVILIMFVVFLFHWMEDHELEQKMLNTEYTQFNKVLDDQTESLNGYVVVDPMKDRFGIPIDDAIEAMIEEHKDDKKKGDRDET